MLSISDLWSRALVTPGGQQPSPAVEVTDGRLQSAEGGLGRACPGDQYYVPPVAHGFASGYLFQPSLDTVPDNRIPNAAADQEAESTRIGPVREDPEHKQIVRPPSAPALDFKEFRFLAQTPLPLHCLRGARRYTVSR